MYIYGKAYSLTVVGAIQLRQSFTEIIEKNAKNGLVPLSHKQCKALLKTIWSG